MEGNDESELDIKEVIIRSESDEWSNDSNDGIKGGKNYGTYNNQCSPSNDVNNREPPVKLEIVKIECDVDVSEYSENEVNNLQTGDCQTGHCAGKVFYHAHGKGKRKFVSMETKLEAIRKLDQGEKVRKVASELGVGEVTVGDWRRNRARIEKWCMEKCSEDASSSRKTMKRSDFEKTSEALFLWFSQARLKGVPVSGPMLQEKALYFHKQLQDGDGSFTASVGWLDRWKKRYGVCRLTMCGDKLSLDLEAVETFQNKLTSLIKSENLTADQLYNCDEMGLKYKMLPPLPRPESTIVDYQKSKERITILACCNASGQHKLPLMIVGKPCYLDPLKNISPTKLKVSYKINKNSLIDRDIFKEWFFEKFVPDTKRFLKEKNLPCKAVLILDSAASHPSEEELINDGIRTLFLPPTYTSLLQPMNQGILMGFKVNYRKDLLKLLLMMREDDNIFNCLKSFSLKDIVHQMAESWFQLPRETIVRAWRKLLINSSETVNETENCEGKSELIKLIKNLPGYESTDENIIGLQRWFENCEGKAHLIKLIQNLPGYESADENIIQQWFDQDDSYEVFGNSANESSNCCDFDTSKGAQNATKQTRALHAKGLAALDASLQYIQQQEEATPADILFIGRWKLYAEKKLFQFQNK